MLYILEKNFKLCFRCKLYWSFPFNEEEERGNINRNQYLSVMRIFLTLYYWVSSFIFHFDRDTYS
jgi:hypothetical protein